MDGAINLMKPPGMSSSDCVVWLRNRLGGIKCGHGGTLDPAASGVLPVLVGKGTRLFDIMLSHEKEYVAVLKLGEATDTLDAEGVITARTICVPSIDDLRCAARDLTGEIIQIPPRFSAIKIDGRKACDIVRNGGEPVIPERRVFVSKLDVEFSLKENEYILTVKCSAGTYIRSLAAELAERVGSLGYLTALVRRASGCFRIENSVTTEEIKKLEAEKRLLSAITPIEMLLKDYPKATVRSSALKRAINGAKLDADELIEGFVPEGLFRLYDTSGGIIALSRCVEGRIEPRIML